MAKTFDVVVLGAGPGGYVAAIRASQLGKKVAIIEADKLGGVCLNRGCIPTKALLKSAHSVHEIHAMKGLGINVELKGLDAGVAVKRANTIAENMSKGISFLMKKNKIEVINGKGVFKTTKSFEVTLSDGKKEEVHFTNAIIATGATYRTFPGLEHDGKRLLGAWEALKVDKLPKSIGIIGAGAIGVEFAYFWNAFGVEVSIFEMQKNLLPIEDTDCSLEVEKAYKKHGIKLHLGIEGITAKNNGNDVTFTVTEGGKKVEHKFEMGLIAVGMTGVVEGFGLGDVSGPPLLAHAASHEGVLAAEHLSGLHPHAIDKMNIPGCTYCQPQVASVGHTERALKEKGIEYKVGKAPFAANGKAIASNENNGFIKVLTGKHGELLGAHIVGTAATELIHEYVLFRTMEGVDEEIFATIHPHPTLGEFLGEAVMAAKGRALNL
jgi:dihydrolipoamide dehydrogenase